MSDYHYALNFEVRDYECDLQGVVNNAVYQHYLEHARHEFIKSRGLDFAALYRQGYSLVVVRIELDYKAPLKSGDSFVVKLNSYRDGRVRFVCHQDIFDAQSKLMVQAKVFWTCVDNHKSRPCFLDDLKVLV